MPFSGYAYIQGRAIQNACFGRDLSSGYDVKLRACKELMIFRGCPIERPGQAGAGEEGHRGSLGSDGGKLVAVSAIINHHNAAVPSPLPSLTLYTIRAGGD